MYNVIHYNGSQECTELKCDGKCRTYIHILLTEPLNVCDDDIFFVAV